MGNRYGPRRDEFDWNLGVKRRLKRYLQAGLTYSEIGMLLGVSRGSVAAAVSRFGLKMSVEQQKEWRARQSWERAKHGSRARSERDWDSKLIETWAERKARKKREAEASPS